jgi:hypothetical protein
MATEPWNDPTWEDDEDIHENKPYRMAPGDPMGAPDVYGEGGVDPTGHPNFQFQPPEFHTGDKPKGWGDQPDIVDTDEGWGDDYDIAVDPDDQEEPGTGGDGQDEPWSPQTFTDPKYWETFMDDFYQGVNLNIPQVSAGSARQENRAVDEYQQYLMDQARLAIENPSRYDAELVQQGMDVIDQQIAEMRRTGTQRIDERMAHRGLAGSSLEAEQHGMHEAALDRTANERAFQLAQDQARTWAQDRSSAFGMGLGAGQQAMTRDQQLMQQDLQNRALQLQAQGMNQDAALRQARLEYDMQHGAADMGLRREAMLQDQHFRQRELELREQGLDADDARWQAELEFRQRQHDDRMDLDWSRLDLQDEQGFMQAFMWALSQDDPDAIAWLREWGQSQGWLDPTGEPTGEDPTQTDY